MADSILAAPLTDDEAAVLEALRAAADGAPDAPYLTFRVLSRRAGMDRDAAGAACRALSSRGLAAYGRGLFTEDGAPAGSGYAITEVGRLIAEARRARAASREEA